MELVGPVVEIIKCSWNPLKKHTGYLKHFQENVKDLSERAKDLAARRMYLENLLRYFTDEEPINEIKGWIEQTIEMEAAAKQIEQKAKEKAKCLICPNPIRIYCISKQAKEKADIVAKHRQVGEFEKLTMPSLTPAVIEEAAPSIKGLSSVESTLKNVMDALGNEKNRIIGVWGMGGIGKTTVVKTLNNQLLGTQLFSKVIVAVVSKDVDINRVQEDIARRLGLTLRNDSSRSSDLSSRLKQEKKFLIILDDLWDRLDLDAIGIPSSSSLKDSRIILTTRKKSVCNKMETQINIKVDVLEDDESWRLFGEKAGDVVGDPAVHATARKVVQECAGLPLAIITVGRALRGCRDARVWDHALAQLQESTPDDIEDMEAKVYIPIKLSYELLRPELKPGFLFCCVYPDDYDIEIDRMIKQWMGEGFLKDAEDLEKTLNKGHSWVAELKASCLLLEGREEGCVRMHDVVRDVGISIASKDKDHRSLVKTAAGLKRLPRELQWDEYKRMSLMRSKIKKLEEIASCRHLLTLMLQENTELQQIDGVVDGAEMLRVLDLSNTALLQVPTSLKKLVNLRVLCLRRCRFLSGWDFTPLASLRQLESLDLSDNEELKELPKVIGELGDLRSLDLTRTPHLVALEQGILSRLARLEELKMLQSFNEWGTYGGNEWSFIMAPLTDVASLTNLSRLFIESKSMNYLVLQCKARDFVNLEKFYVRLGPPAGSAAGNSQPFANKLSRNSVRCMEINGENFYGPHPTTLFGSNLFKQTTGLAFTDCCFSTRVPSANRFESLTYLSIAKCTGLPHVFKREVQPATLDNLRHLELQDLPDLHIISLEDEGLLKNLKDLQVSSCGKLGYLFSCRLLQTMKNLTTIVVESCSSMKNLFEGRVFDLQLGSQESSSILHNLQTLILSRLPSMHHVWEMGSEVSLQNLTTLSVSSCRSLSKSVLSCSTLKGGLPNLVELSVVNCESVEMVISEVTENNHIAFLPKLRKLKLDGLPLLQGVCGGVGEKKAIVGWQSLEEVFVRRCPHLIELEPLRGGREGVPLLKKIEAEERWWAELDWGGDGSMIRSSFQPFVIGLRTT